MYIVRTHRSMFYGIWKFVKVIIVRTKKLKKNTIEVDFSPLLLLDDFELSINIHLEVGEKRSFELEDIKN